MSSLYDRTVHSKLLNNEQQCCLNSQKFLPAGKGFPHVRFLKHRDAQITSYMKLTGNVALDSRYGSASHRGKVNKVARFIPLALDLLPES